MRMSPKGKLAMDKTNKPETIGKRDRRYRFEDELIPLFDLLNAAHPPDDLVNMRKMTIKYLQSLEAKERTPQSRGAGPIPEGLPAAVFVSLETAIENGTIARVKECACGKYFFQRLSRQQFCSVECRVGAERIQESSVAVLRGPSLPKRGRGNQRSV
jgi:hypothetical protein